MIRSDDALMVMFHALDILGRQSVPAFAIARHVLRLQHVQPRLAPYTALHYTTLPQQQYVVPRLIHRERQQQS